MTSAATRSQFKATGLSSSKPARMAGKASGESRHSACHALAAAGLPAPSLPTALIVPTSAGTLSAAASGATQVRTKSMERKAFRLCNELFIAAPFGVRSFSQKLL
jgi:hypothetical protein